MKIVSVEGGVDIFVMVDVRRNNKTVDLSDVQLRSMSACPLLSWALIF